jgi:hypothetical protein
MDRLDGVLVVAVDCFQALPEGNTAEMKMAF